MARVRCFGTEFRARVIEKDAKGYRMEALEHTARTVPGTIFYAYAKEVLSLDDDETPIVASPAALEAAMAVERETLASVKSLIDQAREEGTLSRPKPPETPSA